MTGRSIVLSIPTKQVASVRIAGRVLTLVLLFLAAAAGVRPLLVPPTADTGSPALPGAFSAQRALLDLEVITAAPRVMGTAELDAARAYLAQEFETLGLNPEITETAMVREHAEVGLIVAAQSRNLVARLPGSDSTGAILVAGHLDTVHTTTATSDCGGCAASVLETARALASAPTLRNDVIFLIEDGEETSRAGSLSFVEQHPWAEDVQLAINMEAMGTAGASLLYVTGPENGWLMRESLKVMPAPVAYSFVNDLVWGSGTGGSDLDQFLVAAPVGLGLVYVGNVPAYHTMADNIANLDLHTLQHQGDNVVALARHFGNLPLDGTLTAPNLTYYNVVGNFVVSYPGWVEGIIALVCAIVFVVVVAAGLRRKVLFMRGLLIGAALFVPAVVAATTLSGALWYLVRLLDPRLQVFLVGVTYDREWYTLAFIFLAIGLSMVVYATTGRRSQLELGVGALAWWIVIAGAAAFFLPGSSSAFTLSSLLALIPVAVAVFARGAAAGSGYPVALAVAASGIVLLVVPLLNFLGVFSGRAEFIMGLPMIALLPAPFAAMSAALLLPLFGYLSSNRRWLAPGIAIGAAAAILLGVGITAGFSEQRPKPNMIAYVQENDEAHWVTVGANVADRRASLLDEWTAQFFAEGFEETTFNPYGAYYMDMPYPAYRAPAPQVDLPVPEFQVLSDRVDADSLRHLALHIRSQRAVPMLVLRVDSDDPIVDASLLGESLDEIAASDVPHRRLWMEVFGFSDAGIDLALTIRGEGTVSLMVEERGYSLSELNGVLNGADIAPRPAWMIPSPTFLSDATIVRNTFVPDVPVPDVPVPVQSE